MRLPDIPFDLTLLPEKSGVYIVGGTTRDLLRGQTPADYDIAVTQNPENFAKLTASRGGGRVIPMGRPGKISFRVLTGKTVLDITGVQGPTIRQDLARRDITINAMAIELSSGNLLDWAGGRRDLSERRIRMVSEKVFREDPVRLLRAFRFAAALGFSIEKQTLSTIRRDAGRIHLSAGERLRSELHQLLCCRNSAPVIVMMAENGLLQAIFRMPEASPDSPEPYPPAAYFQDTCEELERLINTPPPGPSALPPEMAPWLKFATLLIRHHRIWKDRPGEKPSTAIVCRRLRLSGRETAFVSGMVRHYVRPFQLHNRFRQARLTTADTTRFFMEVETLAPGLLLHALAVAGDPDLVQDSASFSDFARRLFRDYYEAYLPRKARPPFVTGRDLMTAFNLAPSPLFKQILTRIAEGQLSGEIRDKNSALGIAEKTIRTFKS